MSKSSSKGKQGYLYFSLIKPFIYLQYITDVSKSQCDEGDDVPVAPACIDMMSKLVQLEAGEGAEVQMENQFSLSHRFERNFNDLISLQMINID